jgi:transcription initiation factor TFIIB
MSRSESSPTGRIDAESSPDEGLRCPDCGTTHLDESIEGVDAICKDCGFAIHDVDNPAELLEADPDRGGDSDELDDRRERSSRQEWAEVYTVTNGTQQRIAWAFEHLEDLADALALSEECKLRAATLVASSASENLIDGRPTDAVVAALASIAARGVGDPRPAAIVAQELDRDADSLDRLVRSLHRELDLDYLGSPPEEYLPYLSEELGFASGIERQARTLIDAAHRAGVINGKSPTGVAGAALYVASAGERSQRDVAATVGISKETIRVRIKEFRQEGILDESA